MDHIDQGSGSGIALEERRLEVGFRLVQEEVVKTLDLSCGIGGGYGGRLVESGVDGVLVVTVRALVFEEVVVFCQDGRFCE